MSRQDQYSVSVAIDGISWGVFDQMSGGNVVSDPTKFRPGGMSPQISLGGPTNIDDISVSRLYDHDQIHGRVHGLLPRVGKASVVVTKQPLDRDGNVYGRPLVYNGILLEVNFPDADSESTDPAMLELVVSVTGSVG